MLKTLSLIFLLCVPFAQADVALVSATICNGGQGAHISGITLGNTLRITRNGSMSLNGTVVTSTGFVAADVTRTIIIHGAGAPGGHHLVATIVSRTSTQATISVAAGTAVSNATVIVMGTGTFFLENEDANTEEGIAFRFWAKRQLSLGKTRRQMIGGIVVPDL